MIGKPLQTIYPKSPPAKRANSKRFASTVLVLRGEGALGLLKEPDEAIKLFAIKRDATKEPGKKGDKADSFGLAEAG